MPELPEVETVRRVLESWCINQKVKKVYVYYSPIVNNLSEEEFNNKLVGEEILKMERLGKFLIFRFTNFSLVSHLRMEGKWHYGHFIDNKNINDGICFDPNDHISKDSKHVHFAIEFEDGHLLMYHDVRKFGRIQLFNKDECYYNEPLTRLGYEPFSELINEDYLLNKFLTFKGSVKEALLDQSIIAGLGNIYCDEVLFLTGIIPSMPAYMITNLQANKLINASILTLNKAIDLGGSTIKSYHAANSVDGKFQNSLLVYGRDNQKCTKCDSLIYKTKHGGRGTHFCPKCQKSNIKNRVIGITGFIGSGKSTVANYYVNQGYILLDADEITKNAQLKDNELYNKILRLFKKFNILNDDKELNRNFIRELILKDEKLNNDLKLLVHKYVYKYIFEEIFNHPNNKYVLDVPLLFESHIDEICDIVLFVRCNDDILKNHLLRRNTMPLDDALKLKELQKRTIQEEKITYYIDNNGTLEDLNNYLTNIKL